MHSTLLSPITAINASRVSSILRAAKPEADTFVTSRLHNASTEKLELGEKSAMSKGKSIMLSRKDLIGVADGESPMLDKIDAAKPMSSVYSGRI